MKMKNILLGLASIAEVLNLFVPVLPPATCMAIGGLLRTIASHFQD